MATIQVTPDILRSRARDVRNYKNQHDEVISKMRALVAGLNETWKGEAQTAFVNNFESMRSTFTNFSNLLEDYAQKMDLAANQMEQTDQGLARNFK